MHENKCNSCQSDRPTACQRTGYLRYLHDISIHAVVGVLKNRVTPHKQLYRDNIMHQHLALPKTIEKARSIMGMLEGNGSEDGVAICKVIPLVIPSYTWSELGVCLRPR